MTTANRPYTTAKTLTPGSPIAGGRGLAIAASSGGTVRLKLFSGTTLDILVNDGQNWVDHICVVDIDSAHTTAVCTVSILS